jgi:signal transduction histidine kinase
LDARAAVNIVTADDWKRLSERLRAPSTFCAAWQAFKSGDLAERRDELELFYPARRVLERTVRALRDSRGRMIGWLELFTDVTGERQSETTMLQTEKMAALGRLVSGIAHELNNPLTTIMGYAQLLLGHGLSNDRLAEARNVYHEAERARRIVKNLLYFA